MIILKKEMIILKTEKSMIRAMHGAKLLDRRNKYRGVDRHVGYRGILDGSNK